MTWKYSQRTGRLSLGNIHIATGYSGNGKGRNNPDMQHVRGVGPIPRGMYTISMPYKHPRLGPSVMNLDPMEGTDTLGRSLFRIHGNNISNNASNGCIVMGPAVRKAIAESGDSQLEVVE